MAADASSMTLSMPKAIRSTLPAANPAQMETTASITIQANVMASRRIAFRNRFGFSSASCTSIGNSLFLLVLDRWWFLAELGPVLLGGDFLELRVADEAL